MISGNEHLRIILMEECGELVKEISKSLRFGRSEKMTLDTPTNAERIQTELDDLLTVARMAGFSIQLPEEHRTKKAKQVINYMEYSRSLGVLEK